jgi:hypothetical protein
MGNRGPLYVPRALSVLIFVRTNLFASVRTGETSRIDLKAVVNCGEGGLLQAVLSGMKVLAEERSRCRYDDTLGICHCKTLERGS